MEKFLKSSPRPLGRFRPNISPTSRAAVRPKPSRRPSSPLAADMWGPHVGVIPYLQPAAEPVEPPPSPFESALSGPRVRLVEGFLSLCCPLSFPPRIGANFFVFYPNQTRFRVYLSKLTLGFSGSNPLVWSPISLIQVYIKHPLVVLFRLPQVPSRAVARSTAATLP